MYIVYENQNFISFFFIKIDTFLTNHSVVSSLHEYRELFHLFFFVLKNTLLSCVNQSKLTTASFIYRQLSNDIAPIPKGRYWRRPNSGMHPRKTTPFANTPKNREPYRINAWGTDRPEQLQEAPGTALNII